MSPISRRRMLALSVFGVLLGTACGQRAESGPVREEDVAAQVGALVIMNPLAEEPVTGEVGVLYFLIINTGLSADTLLRVSADVARDVSLHDQADDGASMRMVPVERIEIPGGHTVSLQPGGLHVMLRDIVTAYGVGDSLPVTAWFAGAGKVSFRAPVVSYADVAERSSSGH